MKLLLPALLIGLLLTSCSLSKSLDKTLASARPGVDTLTRDAGRNLAGGFSDSAALLAQRLISGLKGAADTLDPDIRKLYHVIDSIGSLSSDQLVKLGNTLDSQLVKLKGQIDTKKLQQILTSTLEQLTGTLNRQTKNLLANAIQQALSSLKTDSSKRKIDTLVANILSDTTRARLAAFLNGALTPTIDTILAHTHTAVKEDLPFVKQQAVWLLCAVGAIAAALIGWVGYQRRRYARLVEIMTYHIDKLSNQGAYDELTHNIQQSTQAENLEPLLRETLQRQGLKH
jgi:hypothetical protein